MLGLALRKPFTVASEASQQMGKTEEPLLRSRGVLTLTRALGLPRALAPVSAALGGREHGRWGWGFPVPILGMGK